jgi:hypothetical protein
VAEYWRNSGADPPRTVRQPRSHRGEFFAQNAQYSDLLVPERRPREGQGQEVAIPRGYRLRRVEALQTTWLAAAEVRSASVSFACPPANDWRGYGWRIAHPPWSPILMGRLTAVD